MSDTRIYEFEDADWDEFCHNDDHIVPHPGLEITENHSILGDSNKKPRLEVASNITSTGDSSVSRFSFHGGDQRRSSNLSESSKMLEQDSLFNTTSGVFPSSSSSKEASGLTCDNTRSSGQCLKTNSTDPKGDEFCANDTVLSDKATADNSSFSYPLDGIPNTGNNLDFFENTEDNDSSDFLYCSWPEFGNFDDVDRMFRSCDSTFGLGASKECELGWLSSADDIVRSEDVLNSDVKLPSPESKAAVHNVENHDSSNGYLSKGYTVKTNALGYGDSSWTTEKVDPYVSFVKGPFVADSKDVIIPNQQTSELGDQFKLQNQHVEATDKYIANGSSSNISSLSNEALQLSSGVTSDQASPSECMQLPLRTLGSDYVYSQDPVSYGQSDYCHSSDQTLANPVPPFVKPRANDLRSLSQDLPHLSSRLTALPEVVNGKKQHNSQSSSNMSGSSVSGLDGTSPEAAGFHQLQLVMGQLDLRTKLCIRDSLYRLARSAEERHNHESFNEDQRDASGALVTEGANKFMDIETDTNPIDRSIAHLLFHRPSESSRVRASVTSTPVTVKNLKEITPEAEMVSDQ